MSELRYRYFQLIRSVLATCLDECVKIIQDVSRLSPPISKVGETAMALPEPSLSSRSPVTFTCDFNDSRNFAPVGLFRAIVPVNRSPKTF